jgi:CHASE2 domain-containing sensor protein
MSRATAFLKRVRGALAGGGVSLGGRLRRAVPVILIFILLTSLLEYGGWLRSFETAALDTFVLLKKPLEDEHVVIVGITREDYREVFGGRSPLDPARLKEVIDAIAKGNPALIGVDLDTSSEAFRGLQPPPAPVVVWARGAERAALRQQGDAGVAEIGKGLLRGVLPFVFRPEEERFSVSEVLGRDGNALPSGVALLPRDSDGAIRRYRRSFKTWEPDAPSMDSFSWAVVKEYRKSKGGAPEQADESGEIWVMNYAVKEHSFKPISVKEVLNLYQGAGWQGERGPLKDKIVLLGGVYPESRDQHYTPAGSRYGVELLAYAVESDLQGITIRPPSKYLVGLIELLIGFVLVLVHARFGKRPKHLRYTLVAVPLLALLASLFVFSSLALWAIFLPTLLAVLFQQLYEDVQRYRELKVDELYKEAEGLGLDVKQMVTAIRGERAAAPAPEGDGQSETEAAGIAAENADAKPRREERADPAQPSK